jgi:hypothetical protein
VALQGSIDTFALADVLRLLASTGKTGRLALDGDRGRGEVVVVDGGVTGVDLVDVARSGAGPEEGLFELLRFEIADFVFEADDAVRGGEHHGSWPVDGLLDQAERLLAEWREIESVVPSGRAWLTLRPSLHGDHITIGADTWPVLVAVGSGTAAAALAEALSATELAVGRQVRALVELGALEVAPEAPLAPAPVGPTMTDDASWRVAVEPVAPVTQPPAAFGPELGGDEPGDLPAPPAAPVAAAAEQDPMAPPASWFDEPVDHTFRAPDATVPDAPVAMGSAFPADEPFDPDDDHDAADFARQLANLSPKAAKAVAAAAVAATPEERDRVLAQVEQGEDAIDHELLLRFLGADQD